jgi:hypothetical protein
MIALVKCVVPIFTAEMAVGAVPDSSRMCANRFAITDGAVR